jgi:hypothetical protein
VGKPERKRPIRIQRRRWGYKIKMDLKTGWGVWSDLAQDKEQCRALVKTVMNLRVS